MTTPLQPQTVLASLAAEEARPAAQGLPAGAPERDFLRSPAALRVGRLAAAEGLFLFHFEQRQPLELPDHWVQPGREADAAAPQWSAGTLAENKYQSFRHDLMIGSFHPGHRGKWTTHELCHALVGFAWRADATPLFHATAARLAELLPVVLYYYLDEVRLARCSDHAEGGALYRAYCPACESLAAFRPSNGTSDKHAIDNALRYLDGELAAATKSLRMGRPIPYGHTSLNLCSDGLAYARAHGRRLRSEAFHLWVDMFELAGLHTSIEGLCDRIQTVARALMLDEPLATRPGRQWAAQDLAMRLLQLREESDGEAAAALLQLAEGLASGRAPQQVLDDYEALGETFVLPPREVIGAVGYPFAPQHASPNAPTPADGVITTTDGSSLPMTRAGLDSAAPLTLALFASADLAPAAAFVEQGELSRTPIAQRFSKWLDRAYPGVAADLARFESAVLSARADERVATLGTGPGSSGAALAQGFVVVTAERDVVALAERVASGAFQACMQGPRLTIDNDVLAPTGLALGRDADGELLIVGIDVEVAGALQRADFAAIPEAERASLRQLGVVVPSHWSATAPPVAGPDAGGAAGNSTKGES